MAAAVPFLHDLAETGVNFSACFARVFSPCHLFATVRRGRKTRLPNLLSPCKKVSLWSSLLFLRFGLFSFCANCGCTCGKKCGVASVFVKKMGGRGAQSKYRCVRTRVNNSARKCKHKREIPTFFRIWETTLLAPGNGKNKK